MSAVTKPVTCIQTLEGDTHSSDLQRIEFNQAQYELNVRKMAQNETLLSMLKHLKRKSGGGPMLRKYAAPLAAVVYEIPFTPVGWVSGSSEWRHYVRHGHEFDLLTTREYTAAAMQFAARKSETALVIRSLDTETWIKFDPETMEYLILTQEHKIVTYFKVKNYSPESHFEHFLKQYFRTYSTKDQLSNQFQAG